MSNIQHGTYGGAQKCRKTYGEPCDLCKRAFADYQANFRKTHPELEAKRLRQEKIRRKALLILRDRHRREYQEIVKELCV